MRDPRLTAPGGWVVAVMVRPPDEAAPLPHYFAVGYVDQGKAEWTAMDQALAQGEVAASPIAGQEPVAALRLLTQARMATLGLKASETRFLGNRRPRRWLDG